MSGETLGDRFEQVSRGIDEALASIPGTPEHQQKLENLHSLEGQVQAKVEAGELTAEEADEAVDAYIAWIEHGVAF